MTTRTRIASLVAGIALLGAVACQAPPGTAPAPAPADPAAALRPAVETLRDVWNSGELDRLDAVMAADVQRRAPDQDADGLEAFKAFMAQTRTTYPDFHITFDETLCMKDACVVVWTVAGTNTGEGAVPPTGKSIQVSGMTLLRFSGGKVSEELVQYDTATVTEQLGLAQVPHAG